MAGQPTIQQGDFNVAGNLSCRTFTPPEGSIDAQAIQGNAGIEYTKLQQKHQQRYAQKFGTAVVAETVPLHIADGDGDFLKLQVALVTPPTGADTVTLDVQKGNTASAFATVLTTPLVLSNTATARTVYEAVIATADYVAGDVFELLVTVSGTTAQGLIVIGNFVEDPA